MTDAPQITPFLLHIRRSPEVPDPRRRRPRGRRDTLVLRRDGQAPDWANETLHAEQFAADPEVYALTGLLETTAPRHRALILFQVLRASWKGIHPEVRETLQRVTDALMGLLETDTVLTVFLALRRVRANHGHTTRAILCYLLNHPFAEEVARNRRPAVRDCLEHAMGKCVARACNRILRDAALEELLYAERHYLRFADDPGKAERVLLCVYAPAETESEAEPEYRTRERRQSDAASIRPAAVTAENRGEAAAALTRFYRGEETADVADVLNPALDRLAQTLPRFAGRIALVLDASESVRGYGDREWCCLAQSLTLRLALDRTASRVDLYPVGGAARLLAVPTGDTDLAGALIDAVGGSRAEAMPDLVLVVSDGYENRYEGDLARVAATLPQLAERTALPPVFFCHSLFSPADDLTQRRPAPALPELSFWHENDFAEMLILAYAHVPGGAGVETLRAYLLDKLQRVEKEKQLWTS